MKLQARNQTAETQRRRDVPVGGAEKTFLAKNVGECSPSPRTGSALDCVARLSKAAVSPISKSACPKKSKGIVIAKAPQVSKPAIQQARRPALPLRGNVGDAGSFWETGCNRRSGLSPAGPRQRSQQGVALVITLILLSVITFMAVTFLVVSRRESEQVNTLSQQNVAKFAATVAADAAQSQVIALIQASTNGYSFGLLVSTNLINTNFQTGVANITNVAYTYSNGTNLNSADFLMMMTNLLISPRPPVYITTNKAFPPDFRFYIDLNRNGYYDPNNLIMVLTNDAGIKVTNVFIGDPEWIGILDHPDLRHSASNFFVGRFAYIALPIGNSLDFNFMHNQVKKNSPVQDGFLRNQGVSSFEINMAGFLNGINPYYWTYDFYEWQNMGAQSTHFAFDDAASILQYRYNGSYNNLRSFGKLYGGTAAGTVANSFVDYYSLGPLTLTPTPAIVPPDNVSTIQNVSWSGDDNPQPLFTTQDLFNSGLGQFPTRLQQMGQITNSVDRYSFYNLLSQASFGSAPEPYPYPYHTKLNINYSNVTASSANVSVASTNFVGWSPVQFFTNAAIRLLRSRPEFTNAYANLCTNGTIYIPVYPTNFYTPAVHRMLQLAANVYDATTNKTTNAPFDFDYPSVFRPSFIRTGSGANTMIYINGYSEVSNNIDFTQPTDLRRFADFNNFPAGKTIFTNVYGIPYVVGAKSGFPHFNGYSMTPLVTVSRPLQIVKDAVGSTNSKAWHTNVYYTLSISNAQNVACWYPNTNIAYNRAVRIYATNEMTMALTITNQLNQPLAIAPRTYLVPSLANSGNAVLIGVSNWAGSPNLFRYYLNGPSAVNTNSFILPLANLTNFISPSLLTQSPFALNTTNSTSFTFPVSTSYFVPRWALTVTNRVRLLMVDDKTGRLIDYVQLGGLGQLAGLDTYEDINRELTNADTAKITNPNSYPLWVTNILAASNTVPIGFYNQIAYAAGRHPAQTFIWQSTNGEIQGFNQFLYNGSQSPLQSYQVPFTATMIYTNCFTWSANDPLVHYTVSDLADLSLNGLTTNNLWTNNLANQVTNGITFNLLMANQRKINVRRYQPWNAKAGFTSRDSTILGNEIAYQDPIVYSSSDWQFPAYKFPSIGWLGRVHRGTPWQTLYLKSPSITEGVGIPHVNIVTYSNRVSVTNVYANRPSWETWTGNNNYWPGNTNVSDAGMMEPTNDWKIMDLFTTAPNENASRGQLSINQPGLASWMAVLDGVIAVSNSVTATATNFVGFPIDPVTNYAALTNLVVKINNQRAAYPYGAFTSVGDVLSVSNLTVASPFLNLNNAGSLNDAAYEWIPQQIMSLLRVGSPRYVIYAYGQSLKPADRSIVQSGSFFGLCTNYQITGEVVTRTVVRFEPSDPAVLGYPPAYGNPNGTPNFSMRPVVESFAVLPPE